MSDEEVKVQKAGTKGWYHPYKSDKLYAAEVEFGKSNGDVNLATKEIGEEQYHAVDIHVRAEIQPDNQERYFVPDPKATGTRPVIPTAAAASPKEDEKK